MVKGRGRSGDGKDQDKNRKLAAFLVFALMLANNATVHVGRYTRLSPPEEQFDISHLVVVTEAVKFLFAFVGEYIHTTVMGNNGMTLLQSLKSNLWDHPFLETFKLAIPAALFLVQNMLFYVAISNLSSPLFSLTYQAKLVTTALVSVVMLDRKYSIQQWICLVVLSLGVAIAINSESKIASTETNTIAGGGKTGHQQQSLALGLTAIAICCLCGALSGVYFEKILKNNSNNNSKRSIRDMTSSNSSPQSTVSVWFRNMQLSFFSLLLSLLQNYFQSISSLTNFGNAASTTTLQEEQATKPYFHGFTNLVCILVVLRASSGLLGGLVIKHADNVIKGIASSVCCVIGFGVSKIIFEIPLTKEFYLGAVLVLASCFFFSNPIRHSKPGKNIFSAIKDSRSQRRKQRSATTTRTKRFRFLMLVLPLLLSSLFSFRLFLKVFNMENFVDTSSSLMELSLIPTAELKWNQTSLHNQLLNLTSSQITIRSNQTSLHNQVLDLASSQTTMRSNQTYLHHQQVDLSGPPKDRIRFHIIKNSRELKPDCGGCVALHELGYAIQRQGYNVKLRPACPRPHNSRGNLVIIYCEGFGHRCPTPKNVLHIHWMLAPMGVYSEPSSTIDKWWSPNDLVFHYGADKGNMGTKIPVPETNTLTVVRNPRPGDDTDPSVLQAQPNNRTREGVAVVMRKGISTPEIKRAINENSTLPHDKLNLGTIHYFDQQPDDLRLYEYFFSYDAYTFWSLKAAMLGAVSIVYPKPNRSKAEWVKSQYVGSYLLSKGLPLNLPGIAYGFEKEEIEYARQTMHQLRPLLVEAKEWGNTYTVMRMIRDSFRWKRGKRDNFEGAMLARDLYHFK